MKILALKLIAVMLTVASFAVAGDDFSSPIGVRPIRATFAIDPGPTGYSRESTIDTAALYDPRYKLKSVSIMDITIATVGPDLGDFSGTVKVNGATLFTYDGNWSEFNTAQSVLTSRLVKKNYAGINALTNALTRGNPVVLSISGVAAKSPAAKNTNSITLYAPLQGTGVI